MDALAGLQWSAASGDIDYKTLRVTPALEAGLASHVWSLAEIVGLLEQAERPEFAA